MKIDPKLRYANVLAEAQAATPKLRRGERTKNALKLSAITVLDDVGYHRMRVSDICAGAKVSTAAFYQYYTNKHEITLEVLKEFALNLIENLANAPPPERKSAFESMKAANLTWLRAVRANAGLMRCLLQLSDETPEFAAHYRTISHTYNAKLAAAIVRRLEADQEFAPVALLLAYALGSMMDELTRRLLVEQNHHLIAVATELNVTDEDLAAFIAVIWHRAVFARDDGHALNGPAFALAQAAANHMVEPDHRNG